MGKWADTAEAYFGTAETDNVLPGAICNADKDCDEDQERKNPDK